MRADDVRKKDVFTLINGETLKQAIISGANNISSIKARINDLNIFPVPDGDTGTNMSMTITAAAEALKDAEPADVSEVANMTASAMLRGARGNSGVITSLLFRGISKGLEGKAEASGADLIHALGLGVEAAYNAVIEAHKEYKSLRKGIKLADIQEYASTHRGISVPSLFPKWIVPLAFSKGNGIFDYLRKRI